MMVRSSKRIQGVSGADTMNRKNNQVDKDKAIHTVGEIGPKSNIPLPSDLVTQVHIQSSHSNRRALSPLGMEAETTCNVLSSYNNFSPLLVIDEEKNREGHKVSSQIESEEEINFFSHSDIQTEELRTPKTHRRPSMGKTKHRI